MDRAIGLHLRGNQSLAELTEKAVRLNLPFFQCFLRQQSGHIINASSQEIAAFRAVCNHYDQLFIHASYRINLADESMSHHPALKQELYWAQKLGFTHMILHPGASSSYDSGLDAIVTTLNSLIQSTSGIRFILENVAFGAPSIGGSIEDLLLIKNKLDQPDRLGFCIDTAHAYAFGYNLADKNERQHYIQALGQTLGFDQIKLIHINDTQSALGSRHDIHCRIGAGNLASVALKECILDPRLLHVPLLLELPAIAEPEEEQNLNTVRSWHQSL